MAGAYEPSKTDENESKKISVGSQTIDKCAFGIADPAEIIQAKENTVKSEKCSMDVLSEVSSQVFIPQAPILDDVLLK